MMQGLLNNSLLCSFMVKQWWSFTLKKYIQLNITNHETETHWCLLGNLPRLMDLVLVGNEMVLAIFAHTCRLLSHVGGTCESKTYVHIRKGIYV